jgi:hypothetical protein
MITEAHIQVDHDTNYPFEICLPKDCELLKCEVNDKLNQPIARENSVMEILLKNESGKKASSRIYFSYTTRKEKLDAIEGSMILELPQVPIFASEINWQFLMPLNYSITAAEGNMQVVNESGSKTDSRVVLSKKLCRAERPKAQLFYRRRSID